MLPIEFEDDNSLKSARFDWVDEVNIHFLADRTNGRAIATLLRLSSSVVVVCDVMYCG